MFSALLPLHCEKITYGAVIGAFKLLIEITCRKLVAFPVIVHAFAALVLPRTRLVRAIAAAFILFSTALHGSPWYMP
jgi:hypothetical protein